jgi:hypothetical protein
MLPSFPNVLSHAVECVFWEPQFGPKLWSRFILSFMCILGSTRWAKSVAKVPSDPALNKFAAGTWKCNLFVSDMIYESGAK